MKEELLSELSDEELKPPEYYPIDYALIWLAYGNAPINLNYARILYDKPPREIKNEVLKNAEKKLLTYLLGGKISSRSMEYKQEENGKFIPTGKFFTLKKEMWANNFSWYECTLSYQNESGEWYEFTHIQVKTDDLLKCSPLPDSNLKILPQNLVKLQKTTKMAQEKLLGQKERDTLLKMIIGMAIKGYAYDPNAKKSSSIKDISDDLASLGISLDPDTVRKWIKEAAEMLPREDS